MKIQKDRWMGSVSAALLLLTGACGDNRDAAAPVRCPGRIAIRVTAAGAAGTAQAASFDKFGFYAVQKQRPGAEALDGARVHSNVAFARSGGLFLASPAISFPQNDYFAVFDVYGYVPYREQALDDGTAALEMAVTADQSEPADFAASDLLFAKTIDWRAGEGSVPLRFAHAMSRVDLVLKAGEGYRDAGELPMPLAPRLLGVRNSGTFDFMTKTWTLRDDLADLIPCGAFVEKEGVLSGVSAVVPPQTAAAGEPFVRLVAEGESFTYIPAEELVLEAGKRNRITLVLNASFSGVVVTSEVAITDWTDGGEVSMGGQEILPPTGAAVADADQNTYGILRIGRQYWMDANLRTTKYNDGSPIAHVADSEEWMSTQEGAYCYYRHDEANIARYGMLYNRTAAGDRKLCPEGWHIPTVADWDVLGEALGGRINDFGSWIGVASLLKAVRGWPEGEQATDASGFGGLPGGQIVADPNDVSQAGFYYIGTNGYWWCNADLSGEMTYCYGLRTGGDALDQFVKERHSGLSVRCVHDF